MGITLIYYVENELNSTSDVQNIGNGVFQNEKTHKAGDSAQ